MSRLAFADQLRLIFAPPPAPVTDEAYTAHRDANSLMIVETRIFRLFGRRPGDVEFIENDFKQPRRAQLQDVRDRVEAMHEAVGGASPGAASL